MALPNLADLKAHLNDTSSADDDELQLMLDAAIGVVEGIVGPLSGTPVTETHSGVSSPVLVLRRFPVVSLTSVSLRQFVGDVGTTGLLTDYALDTDLGTLRRVDGGLLRGDVTATYTAGRSTVPSAVLLATLIVAGHLWETQRGTSPTQLQGPDADLPTPGFGFAVPSRAQELLAPYAQPSVA